MHANSRTETDPPGGGDRAASPERLRAASETSDQEIIDTFRRELQRQEDILYGVALFFEGVSLLAEGQQSVVETYRKQCRNIIRAGRTEVDGATALLQRVARGDTDVHQLLRFRFSPCEGHSDPGEMIGRALALVEAYEQLFPKRPRMRPMDEPEMRRLMEAVADRI